MYAKASEVITGPANRVDQNSIELIARSECNIYICNAVEAPIVPQNAARMIVLVTIHLPLIIILVKH